MDNTIKAALIGGVAVISAALIPKLLEKPKTLTENKKTTTPQKRKSAKRKTGKKTAPPTRSSIDCKDIVQKTEDSKSPAIACTNGSINIKIN